jgi:hypothetical protein
MEPLKLSIHALRLRSGEPCRSAVLEVPSSDSVGGTLSSHHFRLGWPMPDTLRLHKYVQRWVSSLLSEKTVQTSADW